MRRTQAVPTIYYFERPRPRTCDTPSWSGWACAHHDHSELTLLSPSLHPFFGPMFVMLYQSFTYTVSDGTDSAKAGTVYLVSGGGLLEATEFDFGVGTWQVRHTEARAMSSPKSSFRPVEAPWVLDGLTPVCTGLHSFPTPYVPRLCARVLRRRTRPAPSRPVG